MLLLTFTRLILCDLAVARSFARALGGGISVASAIGFGSTFTLTVPLRVLSDAEAAQPRSPPVTVVVPSNAVPGTALPGAPAIGGGAGSARSSASSRRTSFDTGGGSRTAPEEPPSPADYVCEPVATPRATTDDEAAMRVLADVIGNARDGATSSFRVVVFFRLLTCCSSSPVFVFALEGQEPGATLNLRRCRIVRHTSGEASRTYHTCHLKHTSHESQVFASPSVFNILGWKPEELVGRSCECLMADEAGEAFSTIEECPEETRISSEFSSASPPSRPRPTRTTRQLAASDGTVRWLVRDETLQEQPRHALLTSPCFVRCPPFCNRIASSFVKATILCW